MALEHYTEENGKYLQKNPTWHVEDSPWKAKQVLKMIHKNQLNPGFISEIGCGAGEILNQLHASMAQHIQFVGYDISLDAIAMTQSRVKDRLSFKHENFLEANAHPNLLLMMDVFEHVEDYLGFLKACKGKSDYTIFHIPLDISVQAVLRNNLMAKRKLVGHLHYFTKETALATLTDAGFEVQDYFYTAGSLDLPQHTLLAQMARIPRRILFNLFPDTSVKVFGGFSLLVLAK